MLGHLRPTNKGERRRRNLLTKHYNYGLTRMKLGILRVEVLEVEDEVVKNKVDVVKVIMKLTQMRLGNNRKLAWPWSCKGQWRTV